MNALIPQMGAALRRLLLWGVAGILAAAILLTATILILANVRSDSANSPERPASVTLFRTHSDAALAQPSAGQHQHSLADGTTPVAPSILVKAVDKIAARPGESLRYTLTLDYRGSALLTNVVVSDVAPSGVSLAPGSVSAGGQVNDSQVIWSLGSNSPGSPGLGVMRPGVTTSGAGVALWSNGGTTARSSIWNGTTFAVPANTANLGAPFRIVRVAHAPTRNERIAVGVINAVNNNVVGQLYNGSTWSALSINPLGKANETTWWGADVAYEQQSGDAILLWNHSPNLQFSNWNGSGWSAKSPITTPLAGEHKQMRLVAKPRADEMVAVVSSVNGDFALVWNGSSWGDGVVLYNAVQIDYTDIAAAYEASSGRALVVYGKNNDASLYYRVWDGATWSAEAAIVAPNSLSGRPRWANLASDPNSNRLILSVQTTDPLPWFAVWDGAAWVSVLQASTTNVHSNNAPSTVAAFAGKSGAALAAYSKANQNDLYYRAWTSNGWSAEFTAPRNGLAYPNSMGMWPRPGVSSDDVMVLVQDSAKDLYSLYWNGASLSAPTKLESNTGETRVQPFTFAWDVATGSVLRPGRLTLSAAPSMATAGALITVSMRLTSAETIQNVTPGIVVNGSNGVGAVLVQGPTPASATVGNLPTTFTWVYRATASDAIGQLTVSGNAIGGASTWLAASSNSVIVAPPLAFSVTVRGPHANTTIRNVAYLRDDSGALPPTASNAVETSLGVSVGDYVWNDQDGDTIQDPGEPGLADLLVRLHGPAGMTTTTRTDVDGRYAFTGLSPGNYTITLETSSVPNYFNLVTTPYPLQIRLRAGENYRDADIGLKMNATSVGDFIWYDADMDGIPDSGEPGIGNVLVRLYLDDGDGALDPPEDYLVDSTVTDAAGAYRLDAPVGESYIIDVVDTYDLLSGFIHTLGPYSGVDPSAPISLNTGEVRRDFDFGFVRTLQGEHGLIGDLTWVDSDGDGERDANEPVLTGVEVCALSRGNGSQFCATSDLNGRYLVEAPAGEYEVAPLNAPAGFTLTMASPILIELAAGEQNLAIDFGFHGQGLAAVGGTIWQEIPIDDVVDGFYTPGQEPEIPGVSVSLIRDLSADQVWNAGEPIVATLTEFASGEYLFQGLTPGDYLVDVPDTFQTLAAFQPTQGVDARQDGHSKARPYAVHLETGEIDTTADFGFREFEAVGQTDPTKSAVIGDQVWLDLDGDGVFSGGQANVPLAGVTIQLMNRGSVVASATTGPAGQYLFTELPAGSYTVRVSDAFGVLRAYQPGTPGPHPGQNNNNQAQPYSVSLLQGQVLRSADFAYQPQVSAAVQVEMEALSAGPYRPGEIVALRIRLTNSGGAWIATLPLRLTFDAAFLQFAAASISPNTMTAGQVDWTNLTGSAGGLAPGAVVTLDVSFTARADSSALPGGQATCTAAVYNALADPDGPDGQLGAFMPVSTQQASVGVQIVSPTTVQLASSDVVFLADYAEIRWTTVSEVELTGFYILRWKEGSDWTRVNVDVIPPRKAGRNEGASYFFVDYGASESLTARYRLEVILRNGRSELIDLAATSPRSLFLPLIRR